VVPESVVAHARDPDAAYPQPPFSPGVRYPECPFEHVASAPNAVYGLVREALARLGLDRERLGTRDWNPLGEIVRPRDAVVVKPNWVLHMNHGAGTLDSVTTHPSVVRAILDYIYIALGGKGTVTVGDAPLQKCRLDKLMSAHEWEAIPRFYAERGEFHVRLEDWRLELFVFDAPFTFHRELRQPGDRFRVVDLGSQSALEEVSWDYTNFRVTNYDPAELVANHRPGVHRYCVPRRLLEADVLFNLAKLKSHRKAGLTCCLKNMVGINGHKKYLPHHRRGPATAGHDEYPSPSAAKALATRIAERRDVTKSRLVQLCLGLAQQALKPIIKMAGDVREGSWFGNDTLWRTILDLNRIAMYGDREGKIAPSRKRKVLCIVDAVVAGEGEGPMDASDKRCGAVLAGTNPLVVDAVAARFMGFPRQAIPQIARGFELSELAIFPGKPEDIEVVDEAREPLDSWSSGVEPFRATAGWRARLEKP